MKRKNIILGLITILNGFIDAQIGSPPPSTIIPSTLSNVRNYTEMSWYRGGNFSGGYGVANNKFGTFWNSPIYTYTDSKARAIWTTGNMLTSLVGNTGDGLRILDPIFGGPGNLDLFTSSNNGTQETHIKFGSSGQLIGQNSRLEINGTSGSGLLFNTTNSLGTVNSTGI